MPIPAATTAWGVRAVISAFIIACRLYNKHRDKCERFLSVGTCSVLSAVCNIVQQLLVEEATLPPPGTRGSGTG